MRASTSYVPICWVKSEKKCGLACHDLDVSELNELEIQMTKRCGSLLVVIAMLYNEMDTKKGQKDLKELPKLPMFTVRRLSLLAPQALIFLPPISDAQACAPSNPFFSV